MGRAKVSMKLSEANTRYSKFVKRSKCLKKKAEELKVLCGVEVCLIVYGPESTDKSKAKARELEIWPPNSENVQALIDCYNNQSVEERNKRTETLANFFEKKGQTMENELLKLKKKNEMEKYPAWDDRYDNFSYEQLREVKSILEVKISEARNRIEAIKGSQNCSSSSIVINDFVNPQTQLIPSSFNQNEIAFPINHNPFYQTQQGEGLLQLSEHFMPNDVLMIAPQEMNSNSYFNNFNQFGATSSNNFAQTRGITDDTQFGYFSTPHVGYFENNNSERQMVAPQYLMMDDTSCWYEQMMTGQDPNLGSASGAF